MAQYLRCPPIPGRMIEDQRQHHAKKDVAEGRLAKENWQLPTREQPERWKDDEQVRKDDQHRECPPGEFLERRNHQIKLLLGRKTPGGIENADHRKEVRHVEERIRQIVTDRV